MNGQIKENRAVIEADELPSVFGNRRALTMLFKNLISNALVYGRNGRPPRVEVSASRKDGIWTLAVKDNGIRIDPKDLGSIFLPFNKLHGEEYPGTGLGLALCKKVVERHKGRIWAESVPGQGSVFCFTLHAVQG